MKTRTLLSSSFLLLAALALLVWGRASRARHSADKTWDLLHVKRASLMKEIDDAGRHRVATEGGVSLASKLPTPTETAITPSSEAQKEQATPKRPLAHTMADDPGIQLIWLQRAQAKAALAYGEFFQRQNLSAKQVERFLENKSRLEELSGDLEDAASRGDSEGKNAARMLRQRAQMEYETAQQATLGRENYEELVEYERTAWLRNAVVNTLACGAALAGLPLTAAQGDRLLKAALAATGNDTSTSGEGLVRQIDWEMLDAQAQQILTPEQFAFYRNAAPPGGYKSRWEYQIAAAADGARQVEEERSRRKQGK